MEPDDPRRQAEHDTARALVGRLALSAVGFLLSLVVLEVVLQIAAAYVHATGRRPTIGALTGRRRILSVGDSNTYGLYLEREQAYPQQLGQLWNARHRNSPIEVVNMGYPGNSSSQVVRHLPEMLAAAQPHLLTVMIGVNDFWTVPVSSNEEREGSGSTLWRYSRVYRLGYMLTRMGMRDVTDVEVVAERAAADGSARRTVRYGWMEISEVRAPAKPGSMLGWQESLARNLATIATQAKESGVEVVFLTYPSPHGVYGVTDEVIRKTSADTGTRLVDLAAHFGRLCPQPHCPMLLFKDQHATAPGNALAARLLADSLSRPIEQGDGSPAQ